MQSVDSCRVCGKNPDGPPEEIADRFFEETCARDGRRNFVLTPRRRIHIDPDKLAKIMSKNNFPILSAAKLGISFIPSTDIRACLLTSGIMIAQTPPDTKAAIKEKVFEIYRCIMIEGLGFPQKILPAID
jgi:hypothetical protein